MTPAILAAVAAKPTASETEIPKQDGVSTPQRKRIPRVSLLSGYHLTQGNLRDIVPGGLEARLALDLPLGSGAWPALRFELGCTGYGALPGESNYSVTGTAWAAGPAWIIQPFSRHRGQFIGGFLAGSILARVQGPAVETQTNLLTATALLGYEYLVGPVILFVQARGGYIADRENPLVSAGGVLGVARPFIDD